MQSRKRSSRNAKFAKEFWGKKKGILEFQGEQSFKEGEVTPELAHEIAVKLAEEM